MVVGTGAGALAAWRGWPPIIAFVAALAVFAAIALVLDLGAQLDFQSVVGVLLIAPLIGFLPTGAGFIVGHRFVHNLRHAGNGQAGEDDAK